MWTALQQPAYQHLVINHIPILGMAAGLVGLLVAILMRSRAAAVPVLVIIFLSGISAWPVVETGEAAYKPVHRIADDAGVDWLDEHDERAGHAAWIFYAAAGMALIALLLPLKFPKLGLPLAVAAFLWALAAFGAGLYIAEAGGRIRHPEIRGTATPEP